jgi:hypothetical protein
MLDATNLQKPLRDRVWQRWHRAEALYLRKYQSCLLAPTGPVIPARSSRRLVNIGVGEMHDRYATREINLTQAGIVQLQCIFQLIVPAEITPNAALSSQWNAAEYTKIAESH